MSKLANDMFGVMIDLSEKELSMSDQQLEHLYNVLQVFKQQARMSYEKLDKIPFVRTLFDMIEDQYTYRNNMMNDEDMSEPETEMDSDSDFEVMSDDSEPIKESYTSFYMK